MEVILRFTEVSAKLLNNFRTCAGHNLKIAHKNTVFYFISIHQLVIRIRRVAADANVGGVPAYWLLVESPVLLAARGRAEEAEAALRTMRQQNGVDGHPQVITYVGSSSQSAKEDEAVHGIFYQMKIIFGRQFLFTTFVVGVSTFTLNFNFYGGLYAFPQVLPQLDLQFSPAANLLFGAVAEIPGFFLGLFAASRTTRKSAILAYIASSVASILFLLFGLGTLTGAESPHATLAGFLGMKVFVNVGFLVVYIYASEIYPSVARTSGRGER